MVFLCTWCTPTQCSNSTRSAVYLCHFSLESQREHAEEVARCSFQVKSSLKIVMSGLPCKICHKSNAILKTFGDFSLLCGLQFVEQQFNRMILILWTLIGSNSWSSGANNQATRRSYLAPEVVCQTELRENYTRSFQKLWKHVYFQS